MDLHQDQGRIDLFQDLIHQQEGIVRGIVHAAAANEIHHRHVPGSGLVDAPAYAGGLRRQIGGPQDPAGIIQIVHDFPPGKAVVAQGDHIRPGIQNILRLVGRDAYRAGILSVHHRKIRLGLADQLSQTPAYPLHPRLTDHVPHSQHLKIHGLTPFRFCFHYT